MTSTDPALWTSAPTTGFKMPVMARTMAIKFSAMEKRQIALDGDHHPLGQPQQVGQLPDVVIDQRDVRGVHGDVAAHAAHGDAHIRLFQGGRIVDAVSDHADLMLRLGWLARQSSRACPPAGSPAWTSSMPSCRAMCSRGVFMVAGRAARGQRLPPLPARIMLGVPRAAACRRAPEIPPSGPIHRQIDDRAPLRRRYSAAPVHVRRTRRNAFLREQFLISCEDCPLHRSAPVHPGPGASGTALNLGNELAACLRGNS